MTANALSALQSGRFAEAEQLLRAQLAAAPEHPEALHLLGVALARQGRFPEAIAALDRAVALQPQSAACLHNRAQALLGAGRMAEASADLARSVALAPAFEAGWIALGNVAAAAGDAVAAERHYRRALGLRAENPDAQYNLALLLQNQGRLEEAIAGYRRALAARPAFAAAHNNLANALTLSGREGEAMAHYAEAIRIDPQLADALANLGLALRQAGRIDESVAMLERAAQARPDNPEVLNNLGVSYFARNRFGDAEACYRRALALRPGMREARNNLGNALAGQGREAEAIALYREILAESPDYADAHSNLGLLLQERDEAGAAIVCYERALALNPTHADALNNLGYLLQETGRGDEAIALYRRALAADPGAHRASYNLGLAHLCRFEFAEGWPRCESRYLTTPPVAVLRAFRIPKLAAADLGRGERIAVWKEQGLGDQLLYATLLPELEARGESFVLEIDQRLIPAVKRAHPGWEVVAYDERQAAFASCTRHAATATLAGLLRTSRGDFARQPKALLTADPQRARAFRERLAEPGKRLVGISWRSFQPSERGYVQRKKSAPLEYFGRLSQRPDVKLLDLQYNDTADERATFAASGGRLLHLDDLDLKNDLDGVLAVVQACDLVITTSNVTAHYAGALGREAWLLYLAGNPPFHYWTPDANGRCLWYPSVRIITGAQWRTWDALLAHVDGLLDA